MTLTSKATTSITTKASVRPTLLSTNEFAGANLRKLNLSSIRLISSNPTDPTYELFRLCSLRWDDNNEITRKNISNTLQQHQEHVLQNVTSILSKHPHLVHSTTIDIIMNTTLKELPTSLFYEQYIGYNLLHCICMNPSLMNYIPLIQYLIQTSEYITESKDYVFDTNNNDDSDISTNRSNRFGHCFIEKMKQRFSSSKLLSPILPVVATLQQWNSSIAMNDIIPTQARIIREQTNDTRNGYNCLHLLLQNCFDRHNFLLLHRNTLKFFLKSYPASICCKDYTNNHVPLHYACLNAYRYYTNPTEYENHRTSPISDDANNDTNNISDIISPIEIIMLLVQQYPEACTIPNRDGNLPLHLVVAGMYLGTITTTTTTGTTTVATGTTNNNKSKNHVLTKLKAKVRPKGTTKFPTLEGDSARDNSRSTCSASRSSNHLRQFFRQSFGQFRTTATTNNNKDTNVTSKNESVKANIISNNENTGFIMEGQENDNDNYCPDLDETHVSDDEEDMIIIFADEEDEEDYMTVNTTTSSTMSVSLPLLDKTIPVSSSPVKGRMESILNPSNTNFNNSIDGLLDTIQYLVETYPDALEICNHNGYTPSQLALAHYQDPETTFMSKDLKIVNLLTKLSRRCGEKKEEERNHLRNSITKRRDSIGRNGYSSLNSTTTSYVLDPSEEQPDRLIL